MRRILNTTIARAVVSVFSSSVSGKYTALTLKKGIFNEEAKGDVGTAMKIYQQIIEDDKINRRYVAEGQYRLGMFHLNKGDETRAIEQFSQLANMYPDQKAIIARANAELYMRRFREQGNSCMFA